VWVDLSVERRVVIKSTSRSKVAMNAGVVRTVIFLYRIVINISIWHDVRAWYQGSICLRPAPPWCEFEFEA
jgi:hypothetical protein